MTGFMKNLSKLGMWKWACLAAAAAVFLACYEIPDWLDEVNNITDLRATANSESSITVSWTYISSPAIAGYYVYRSSSSYGSYTRIGSSTSGQYTDNSVSANTTYYYKVAAYNNSGKTASQSNYYSAKTPDGNDPGTNPGVGGTFTDSRDGKKYNTVKIDNQTWLAQNLNYDVPNVSTDVCYNNSADSCAKYGRLYNWATAMGGASSSNKVPSGVRGVCPVGWHLPSDDEWTQLTNYVGSNAGAKLKSTSGWYSNGNGTDAHGFSALPGGYGYSDGSFSHVGKDGLWWSATEDDADYAWFRVMYYDSEYVDRYKFVKTFLLSVRCVQD